MTDLKPCPFCGGMASEPESSGECYYVGCNSCGVATAYFAHRGSAAKAWNMRTNPELDALKARVRESWLPVVEREADSVASHRIAAEMREVTG